MRRYRVALFMLCIALLGAMPLIISLPKPVSADSRLAAISQVRPEIRATLQQALLMGPNTALKLIDGLSALPNKNNLETQEINQVRGFFVAGPPYTAPKK